MLVSFKYFKFSLFILAITCIFIITGCSSSSNSVRYGSDNSKPERDTRIRYPDNEVGKNNQNDSDPDYTPDVESIDASTFKQKYYPSEGKTPSTAKEKMMMEIIKYMNTPYKFGGESKNGIDCSAFTQTVYNSCNIHLLRTAREQYTQGIEIDNKRNLKFGDLVFFNTRKTVKPGHVGIYIGDNLFVHASSSNGVIVTPLSAEYYFERFMGARRIDFSSDIQ